MKIDEMPHYGTPLLLDGGRVAVDRNVGVVTRDGVRLSVDVYRPNRTGRFPTLLEHIPYRKDDLRAKSDRGQNIYLVNAGFACVRLDVRGTGSSGGRAMDEYTVEEQLDGVEVVEWIARQPWCTGAVGSWGLSYGGFSCIQLATHRPPALRAIAPLYATDDRYTDDVHFEGGALSAFELAGYPIRMLAMNALPLGDSIGSDEQWRARIAQTPAWVIRWITEQRDGPYWRNGSLRPAYDRVQCPVLIVSGWRDSYRSAAVRMATHLGSEWEFLGGPWAHVAPDDGVPEPGYPLLDQLSRFFHRHLSDGPVGRPRSILFLGHSEAPYHPSKAVPGEWFQSESWPQGSATRSLELGRPSVAPPSVIVGAMTGNWCPPPPAHGQFFDQRSDEARSAVFTGDPLDEPIEVVGIPVARFTVRHPGPRAILSVKLNDVAADGYSQPVTRGAVNAILQGDTSVEVPMLATGWRFLPGHRIRVAVAVNDWPCIWPLPGLEPLHVTTPVSLELPGLPPDARPYVPSGDTTRTAWQEAEVVGRHPTWRIETDGMRGTTSVEASFSERVRFPQEGISYAEAFRRLATAREGDPLSVQVAGWRSFRVSRDGHEFDARASGRFRCTSSDFILDLRLQVSVDGRPFAQRSWVEKIPRLTC